MWMSERVMHMKWHKQRDRQQHQREKTRTEV
jgi:hypothetical protein